MLLLAHAFSWAVALGLYATGGMGTPWRHVVGGFAFMIGPAIGAVVAVRGLPKGERGGVLAIARPKLDRWLVLAWLVPLLLVGAATLASGLVPGVAVRSPAAGLVATLDAADPGKSGRLTAFPPAVLSLLLTLQAAVMGAALNVPMMLSEELGWRGLLWSQWRSLGFWRHAAMTGFVWGVWHAPLISLGHNYPGMPVSGIGLMIVFCMLLTPALHLVRDRGGTVWHACVFHGTINASATLGTLCIAAPSWVGRGITGMPGFVVLAASVVLVAMVRGSDGRAREAR
jgi:hypothetical protein